MRYPKFNKNALALILLFYCTSIFSQSASIKSMPVDDKFASAVFMDMVGFTTFSFELVCPTPKYINLILDEYLNDSLVSSFNHFGNKGKYTKDFYPIVYPATTNTIVPVRFFALEKSDTLVQLNVRPDRISIVKKLVISPKLHYAWKRADEENEKPIKIETNKKIPLLYFASAVVEQKGETEINKYCAIPTLIKNKASIKNKGKISHYFIVNIELRDSVD